MQQSINNYDFKEIQGNSNNLNNFYPQTQNRSQTHMSVLSQDIPRSRSREKINNIEVNPNSLHQPQSFENSCNLSNHQGDNSNKPFNSKCILSLFRL